MKAFNQTLKKVQQTNRFFDLGRSATLGQPVTQLNATEHFCAQHY